jgi:hypothetical protein
MLSRDILNILLPDGSFWIPEIDQDYDNLFQGIAENSEEIKTFLNDLRFLRDPDNTTILSDLENEYGVIPEPSATEAERRARLKSRKYQQDRLPTYDVLQAKLQEAGFDVQVHANSPAVDPDTFIDEAFQMVCGETLPGGNDAQCGEAEAYCGRIGGELLVNGNTFEQIKNFITTCNETLAQCGESSAQAGNFDSVRLVRTDSYDVPATAGYWPLIFFVGGDATRNVAGEITNIEIVDISLLREFELKTIILQYKPMFSWAALIINFV